MTGRGFSLLEAMVAIVMAGVVAAIVVATFKGSLDEQSRSKNDWQAFTIAQQQMELFAALPRSSAMLNENDTNANPGSVADATCTGVPTGDGRHQRVDALGNLSATGSFDVCVKVTDNKPEGALKYVRVIVDYTGHNGATEHVALQTVR